MWGVSAWAALVSDFVPTLRDLGGQAHQEGEKVLFSTGPQHHNLMWFRQLTPELAMLHVEGDLKFYGCNLCLMALVEEFKTRGSWLARWFHFREQGGTFPEYDPPFYIARQWHEAEGWEDRTSLPYHLISAGAREQRVFDLFGLQELLKEKDVSPHWRSETRPGGRWSPEAEAAWRRVLENQGSLRP